MSAQGVAMTRSRIAVGGDKRAERSRLRDDFQRARGNYLAAVTEVIRLHQVVAEAKVTIQHERDNQKGIEAGWGTPTGTNAEARKATLEEWRGTHDDWQQCQATILAAEETVRRNEPMIVAQEYDIRIARYEMEMNIAEMRALAGEQDERHER
jgi:hypothetical protein